MRARAERKPLPCKLVQRNSRLAISPSWWVAFSALSRTKSVRSERIDHLDPLLECESLESSNHQDDRGGKARFSKGFRVVRRCDQKRRRAAAARAELPRSSSCRLDRARAERPTSRPPAKAAIAGAQNQRPTRSRLGFPDQRQTPPSSRTPNAQSFGGSARRNGHGFSGSKPRSRKDCLQ